ncbi:MAG: hypothetical protein FH753_16140 [Firmicutes bacterium]|nr:hypothetical protein [Bacillota bacterium]
MNNLLISVIGLIIVFLFFISIITISIFKMKISNKTHLKIVRKIFQVTMIATMVILSWLRIKR